MDVRETRIPGLEKIDATHWYYDAKFRLLRQFVTDHAPTAGGGLTILDVGCGSGLLLKRLADEFPHPDWRFIGLDPFREDVPDWNDARMEFTRTLRSGLNVDIVLMIDVIEHVPCDFLFVRSLLESILQPASRPRNTPLAILATVPAHQGLWSAHDEFLGHVRRYSLGDLMAVFPQEVRPLFSHYYYASILPVAVPMRLLHRNSPPQSDMRPASPAVNRVLKAVLGLEWRVARHNRLAGLTAVFAGRVFPRPVLAASPGSGAEAPATVQLILPAYKERTRLPRLLRQIEEAAETGSVPPNLRIIVADDGSPEEESRDMLALVEASQRSHPSLQGCLTFRRFHVNQGKGGVLRSLFRESLDQRETGVVGFLDADGATPFREWLRCLAVLNEDPTLDAVIGSRVRCLGNVMGRRWSRHLSGRVFATLVGLLFSIPVYDSQCGAKLFRCRSLDRNLLEACDNNRWVFDTQLLIALWQRGASIREVPVDWRETEGSHVHILRDGVRMLGSLLRFRRVLRSRQP